jgi:sugar lactone lactonase YvrE
VTDNPILDFGIDKQSLQYVGSDLQRPECILAERDGTLWSADARGGVVRIAKDGRQQIIIQQQSGHFEDAASEAARYLQGTIPNGMAFARNGDFLIANFGPTVSRSCPETASPEFSRTASMVSLSVR